MIFYSGLRPYLKTSNNDDDDDDAQRIKEENLTV